MRRIMLGILILASTLVASCASLPNYDTEAPRREAKKCSDSPRDAVSMFMRGMAEFSITLLRAVTLDRVTLYEVFGNNDEERGKEVIREIAANPEVTGEIGSCTCSILSMTDTADPREKIFSVKRVVASEDEVHYYKRAFRVRFASYGNCILTIERVNSQWERIS